MHLRIAVARGEALATSLLASAAPTGFIFVPPATALVSHVVPTSPGGLRGHLPDGLYPAAARSPNWITLAPVRNAAQSFISALRFSSFWPR